MNVEKKSLYELMNEALQNKVAHPDYRMIDQFIFDDVKCVDFINALAGDYDIRTDREITQLAKRRAKHSVITFLLGIVFEKFGGLFNEFSNTINIGSERCFGVWLLASLYHDRGYFSKMISDFEIDLKKAFSFYLFDDHEEDESLSELHDFRNKYPRICAYSYDEIEAYDSYAREYHLREHIGDADNVDNAEMIDHGILGGCIAYDKALRRLLKSNQAGGEYKIIKAACLTIAQHNIFKSNSKKSDEFYPKILLPKLSYNSDFRISRNTPILLLLSIVDTVECVKRFGKSADQSMKGTSRYLETISILKSIFAKVDENKIELDFIKLNSLIVEKGFFEEYISKYWNGILHLSNWTELKVEKKENSRFVIKLG